MSLAASPLGRPVVYPDRYDPSVLFPIPRAQNRGALFEGATLPFVGADIWNAYEISWLNKRGKPEVAMATFVVPAESPNIIESKSFKLYLNSFNQTRLQSAAELQSRLETDLARVARLAVEVRLIDARDFGRQAIAELGGFDLDTQDIDIHHYQPAPQLLRVDESGQVVEESLSSRLLKSNCPVTGQPDWGSVQIRYRGRPIDRAALLAYIVSFREHAEFHEHCVERIFTDVMAACRCEALTVYARYTRRGGLDINPWRSSRILDLPAYIRTARQ
jgi:7-cyano-7-deazaguanine reductase